MEESTRQGSSDEETMITQCFIDLYQREEVMGLQRSLVQWLVEGDKNTRFVHLWVSQWKKKPQSSRLTRPHGIVTKYDQEMVNMTHDFYEKLYLL
jgi:hypothetical protein